MADELDEDYMSDAFLHQSTEVRPGLLTKAQKRKLKDKGRDDSSKFPQKKKKLEDDHRQQGLATPLSQDNKGFALLEKMGYKKGHGIGKSGKEETSLIPLVLKDGRSGLGRRSFLQKQEEEKVVRKQKHEEASLTTFIQRKQQAQKLLRTERDFKMSQQTCEQLDKKSGYSEPTTSWFWAVEQVHEEDEESDSDNEEELTVSDKLAQLTEYLRCHYYYCVWCGITYENEGDMITHCPGNNREIHDNS